MENLKNNFSLRETLEILLPGFFFISFLIPIIAKTSYESLTYSSVPNVTSLIILSFTYGIFIYILDVPKKIWFFKNILPTKILEKEFENIQDKDIIKKIHNAYFSFYDTSFSPELKNKTDIYTGIYHFSVNITLSAFLLLIIYLLVFLFEKTIDVHVFIVSIIFLFSTTNCYFIVNSPKKIKYMFSRQVLKFKESDEYRNLINLI